jgi:hypothetical protein
VDGASFMSKGSMFIYPEDRSLATDQSINRPDRSGITYTQTHMRRRELTDHRHSLNREKYILLLWKADRNQNCKVGLGGFTITPFRLVV